MVESGASPRRSLAEILAIPPVNAWLLVGDDASYPTPVEQRRNRTSWRSDATWTGPKQAQPGDLLFFYFVAPRKAIHFVARAVDHPIFDSAIQVNALQPVDSNQWWVTHTPLVELNTVSFSDLQLAMGGHLILQGKPTHYLSPYEAAMILQRGIGRRNSSELDRAALQVSTGDPTLPDPAIVDLRGWARLAAGPLKLEHQVEHYVVEPLLRLAFRGEKGVTFKKSYKIGRGIADYGVLRDGKLTGVVEVKLAVRETRSGPWSHSPDFAQVMRYSDAAGVPAALVDSNRIFLIHTGGVAPSVIITRKDATAADLRLISRHLAGEVVRKPTQKAAGPPADWRSGRRPRADAAGRRPRCKPGTRTNGRRW